MYLLLPHNAMIANQRAHENPQFKAQSYNKPSLENCPINWWPIGGGKPMSMGYEDQNHTSSYSDSNTRPH